MHEICVDGYVGTGDCTRDCNGMNRSSNPPLSNCIAPSAVPPLSSHHSPTEAVVCCVMDARAVKAFVESVVPSIDCDHTCGRREHWPFAMKRRIDSIDCCVR